MLLLPLSLLLSAAPALQTTLPEGRWELMASGGVGGRVTFSGTPRWDAAASVGITDRFQVSLLWPAMAFRFGDPGGAEGWLAAGMFGVRRDDVQGDLRYELGPALGLRWWATPTLALAVSVEGSHTRFLTVNPTSPDFTITASAGVTFAITDAVTMHLAAGVTNTNPVIPNIWLEVPYIGLGSVQRIAMRRPPLLEVRVLPFLSAELTASVWANPLRGAGHWEVLAGATAQWP